MSGHSDVTLVTHSVTDGAQTQTQEAEALQRHGLTYPDVVAKP